MFWNLFNVLMIIGFWQGFAGVAGADEVSVKRPGPESAFPSITSYTLPNGLKVLLYPDAKKKEVTVNVVYKSGARHELPGEYGVAHLLEHLAFQNTQNFREIPKELERRGARFNANTNSDRTTYYETLPASLENLEYALAMEADRMINTLLSETAIQAEWAAVKKEWEQSSRSGFQPLLKEMLQLAYPHHAYGRDTFGLDESLGPIPSENLRSFYARRYAPHLAVLTVGGNYQFADAKGLIAKYFGPLPERRHEREAYAGNLRSQWSEKLVVIPKPGGPSYVGVVYRAMPGADPSYVAAQALVHCLTSDRQSLLQKKLLRSGWAQDVFGFVQQAVDEGFIAFMARPGPGRDPLQLVQRLAQLVESSALSCQGKDLERFQKENSAAWAALKQDARALSMQLGEFEVLGDWRLMLNEQSQSQQLTLDDLRNVSRWIVRTNRTAGVLDHRGHHSLAGRRVLP